MAKIKGNIIMMNLSGMLGKQIIIKHRNGKPYACAPPTIDENRPLTPNKKAWREKFRLLAAYAKAATRDPQKKAAYLAAAKPGQTAYNVAFMAARYAPVVTALSVQGYAGKRNDKIFVQATDDFKVCSVKVAIYSTTGELIEEGDASPDDVIWMYKTTRLNKNVIGTKIIAKAYDLPGNEGAMEKVL